MKIKNEKLKRPCGGEERRDGGAVGWWCGEEDGETEATRTITLRRNTELIAYFVRATGLTDGQESRMQVTTTNGLLTVRNATAPVEVLSVTGERIGKVDGEDAVFVLPAGGMYIVKDAAGSLKVAVR